MNLVDTLRTYPFILTEGAVVERLRREFNIQLNPYIVHSGLIYENSKKAILYKIYKQYIDIAQKNDFPIMIFTPTRRCNSEQIKSAGLDDKDVNGDCSKFLQEIRSEYNGFAEKIFIGGLMGCKGDAYDGNKALTTDESKSFHQKQALALVESGVDFLCGATLPALSEALGLAHVMATTNLPYILSFVIRENGTLLDGTSLYEAISIIDNTVPVKPIFYMVNCVHPSILLKAFLNQNNCPKLVKERLIGIQANSSTKSPEELDNATKLESEDRDVLINKMLLLHKEYNLKVLGGCCGTDNKYLQMLVNELNREFRKG